MDGGQASPVLDRNRQSILLLYAARAVRGFGDGFAVIILPAYLAEIGFDALQIGIVATAALLGTAAATLLIGHLGARARYSQSAVARRSLSWWRAASCFRTRSTSCWSR